MANTEPIYNDNAELLAWAERAGLLNADGWITDDEALELIRRIVQIVDLGKVAAVNN